MQLSSDYANSYADGYRRGLKDGKQMAVCLVRDMLDSSKSKFKGRDDLILQDMNEVLEIMLKEGE